MALSEAKMREYVNKVLLSRMRILCNHGFFGLLLMHVSYSVSEDVDTACTDGNTITFGTEFLDELSESELDFVMMHEIMHIVLLHCSRGKCLDHEAFNVACDIVVNSNILLESNMDLGSITLKKYGESMHVAPDGKEGYLYTAEEVYEMLPVSKRPMPRVGMPGGGGSGDQSKGQPDVSPRFPDGSRHRTHKSCVRCGNPDGVEGQGKPAAASHRSGAGGAGGWYISYGDHLRPGGVQLKKTGQKPF